MEPSENQQQLFDVIEDFMCKEASNLYIEPPTQRRFNGLNYCLLKFMTTFKNEGMKKFYQLNYVVDFNWQAKLAYETFCEITDAENRQFYIKGGKEGNYKIQFTHDGPTYRFISKYKRILRGISPQAICLFNLLMPDDDPSLEFFKKSDVTKSIWIIHDAGKVANMASREEELKITNSSCFCIIK